MKALKKSFLTALIFCLSLSMFTGCSDTNQNVDQSPSADPPNTSSAEATPTASDEPEVPDDKEINAAKEKVKLTMLLCDSGLTIPNGVDINDNAWADAIKEWANVDLTIEQPLYTDYDTKLQLRLSAGDLPDIVHCIGTSYSTTAPEAARDGAFIALDDYYQNSRNVKNVITPEMMEWVKEPTTGKNFFIPMKYQGLPEGSWLIARWDLVEKYNNGKWPETTPEWIAFFEKVKQEIPEAMVLSNWLLKIDYALTYGGRVVYQLYGLPGTGGGGEVWDWKNQKFENEFLTPEYKEATKVMRDLYEKGILDPEFATTEKWDENKKAKDVVAEANHIRQVSLSRPNYDDFPEANSQEWRGAAPLKEFPDVVRYPEVAYGTSNNGVAAQHGMYISSKCANPDRAFDVLEVMASEEFRDLCVWGKEGYSYEVVDGEKVPIEEVYNLDKNDPNVFSWQRQFLIIWGYSATKPYEIAYAEMTDKEYAEEQVASYTAIDDIAREVPMSPKDIPGFVASDTASRQSATSQTEMSTITCNYIMGRMSEADFDQAVADWQDKYGYMADEMTEYVLAYDREQAAAMGISYTLN